MTITANGILEIDQNRGVVYFHCTETGTSLMRICRLPTPIPDPRKQGEYDTPMLDLTWGHGVNWGNFPVRNDEPIPTISTIPNRTEYEHALMIVTKYEEAETEAKIRRNHG